MKRIAFLASVFTTVLVLVMPFVGGAGPALGSASATTVADSAPLSSLIAPSAESVSVARGSSGIVIAADPAAVAAQTAANTASATQDSEHLAQKPVPKPVPPATASPDDRRAYLASQGQSCPGDAGGSVGGAPGITSPLGVGGTTSDDLASFAHQYNAIRVANCLDPIPYGNFYYDSCMEQRLFWMAEDPSLDPSSAWGHMGSQRSDGVPSVGCDGNLAGGSGNTGTTVAQKWWDSLAHRATLYRPGSSISGVCIGFAMTHGGVPNEPYDFTRAAAVWTYC
jgi:hypothetical protein